MPRYERVCSKCKTAKGDDEFYSIFTSWCTDCSKEASKDHYERKSEDPEFRKDRVQRTQKWREANPRRYVNAKTRHAARLRAKTRLAQMFPQEFDKLVQEELRKSAPKRKKKV